MVGRVEKELAEREVAWRDGRADLPLPSSPRNCETVNSPGLK